MNLIFWANHSPALMALQQWELLLEACLLLGSSYIWLHAGFSQGCMQFGPESLYQIQTAHLRLTVSSAWTVLKGKLLHYTQGERLASVCAPLSLISPPCTLQWSALFLFLDGLLIVMKQATVKLCWHFPFSVLNKSHSHFMSVQLWSIFQRGSDTQMCLTELQRMHSKVITRCVFTFVLVPSVHTIIIASLLKELILYWFYLQRRRWKRFVEHSTVDHILVWLIKAGVC